MKARGNGTPETCASNLLRIVRGEVPYDRVRGRDSTLVDQPNATDEALADIEWLINTYEPRVTIDSSEARADTELCGDYSTIVSINRRKEEA